MKKAVLYSAVKVIPVSTDGFVKSVECECYSGCEYVDALAVARAMSNMYGLGRVYANGLIIAECNDGICDTVS